MDVVNRVCPERCCGRFRVLLDESPVGRESGGRVASFVEKDPTPVEAQ